MAHSNEGVSAQTEHLRRSQQLADWIDDTTRHLLLLRGIAANQQNLAVGQKGGGMTVAWRRHRPRGWSPAVCRRVEKLRVGRGESRLGVTARYQHGAIGHEGRRLATQGRQSHADECPVLSLRVVDL